MERRQGGGRRDQGNNRSKKDANNRAQEESKGESNRAQQAGNNRRKKASQQQQQTQAASAKVTQNQHMGVNPFKEMQLRDLARKQAEKEKSNNVSTMSSPPDKQAEPAQNKTTASPAEEEKQLGAASLFPELSGSESQVMVSPLEKIQKSPLTLEKQLVSGGSQPKSKQGQSAKQATSSQQKSSELSSGGGDKAALSKSLTKERTLNISVEKTPSLGQVVSESADGESTVTSNFEQMLRQLDKSDLLPPPKLLQTSSEVIEDRKTNTSNLGLEAKFSADFNAAMESSSKQSKRRRSTKDKSQAAAASKDAPRSQANTEKSFSKLQDLIIEGQSTPRATHQQQTSDFQSKLETVESVGGDKPRHNAKDDKKTKINLQCLKAQSSVELLTQDQKSTNTADERKRSNSFAHPSFDEPSSETLQKWNFDFNADSDSIESFDSTKMTNSLPPPEQSSLPLYQAQFMTSHFEPFQVHHQMEVDTDFASASPNATPQSSNKHGGVHINLQGHGDGLLNYYLQQDDDKNQNQLTMLFNQEQFSPFSRMFPQQPGHGQAQQSSQVLHPGHDFETALEMSRPWLEESTDIGDYFNYQFNEHAFLQFINRQIRIQLQRERDDMLRGGSSSAQHNPYSHQHNHNNNGGGGGGHHHSSYHHHVSAGYSRNSYPQQHQASQHLQFMPSQQSSRGGGGDYQQRQSYNNSSGYYHHGGSGYQQSSNYHQGGGRGRNSYNSHYNNSHHHNHHHYQGSHYR